jgi:DNA polymerase III epsilon subunit-like protein
MSEKKKQPEAYVSIDIETDGPAPGVNSMLALGAAVFEDGDDLPGDTFYQKLLPLEGAYQSTETMDWWTTQPEAWAEVNRDRREAAHVMFEFVAWCDKLKHDMGCKLVAVGWPIAFDFAFVNYYCHRFTGRNPLGFAGLDIRSYANGLAEFQSYYGLSEDTIRTWSGPVSTKGLRDHFAVDDAIGQGKLFMGLRKNAVHRTSFEDTDD